MFRLLLEQGFQVLFDVGVADTLQLLRRDHCQQVPAQFERLLDDTVLVLALADVAVLEGVGELRERLVLLRQKISFKFFIFILLALVNIS